MAVPRIAILDDTQGVAESSADWSKLNSKAEIHFFNRSFDDENDAAAALEPFEIIVALRERTLFPGSLISKLPRLRMVAMTGPAPRSLDIAACTTNRIVVCTTGVNGTASTAELALALLLSSARSVAKADANMHLDKWHEGMELGTVLEGRRLGIVGLGNIGLRMARYGHALGMEVVAWSQNLTEAHATRHGVAGVTKEELFRSCDAVSIHLVLSDRSRHAIGAAELAALPDGAIIVNTSRGPIIHEKALLAELNTGRIRAGLDVFDREPLPAGHPFRRLPNLVMTPHLGYSSDGIFQQFFHESLENILAFLKGKPIRVANPEVLYVPMPDR
jgi:phosphoglycerate dehydrogenase-like enzyme